MRDERAVEGALSPTLSRPCNWRGYVLTFRHHWRGLKGLYKVQFDTSSIQQASVVVITASEFRDKQTAFWDETLDRFVGDASIWVSNIAPFNGGVFFYLHVDWGGGLLAVVTDITVLDPESLVVGYQ